MDDAGTVAGAAQTGRRGSLRGLRELADFAGHCDLSFSPLPPTTTARPRSIRTCSSP